MKILENYSLLPHNTFGIPAKTELFVEYETVEELQSVISSGKLQNVKFLHIGLGSNLLFLKDFAGVILHSANKHIEIVDDKEDEVLVKVGAGYDWDEFVSYCVTKNWYGLENLSLIPGEVGSSAVQNIGAYGVEVKDLIYKVYCVDVQTAATKEFTKEECKYDYRQSIFKNELKGKYFVTDVIFKLSKIPEYHLEYGHLKAEVDKKKELTLTTVRDTIIEIRISKLPDYHEIGNAGSFFMNPVVDVRLAENLLKEYPTMPNYKVNEALTKIPAGWLIEQAGWKGKSLGNAGVYTHQALVLVNLGGATGQDIENLAIQIQKDVLEKFNIPLVPEVNYIL